MQLNALIEARGKAARVAGRQIVADDAKALHPVMQAIEARRFELTQPERDDTAPSAESMFEPVTEIHVEAVGQKVPTAEPPSVSNQLLEIETDRRVVRGDDGAGADAHDHVDRDALTNELPKHADVSSATEAARTQHHADANAFRSADHAIHVVVASKCDDDRCAIQ